LGILVVKNVPKYQEFRQNLLSLAKKFGEFDEKTKKKYEGKNSNFVNKIKRFKQPLQFRVEFWKRKICWKI
jgi:isopenicillin N synthase-like dioxygenase